MKFGSLSLAAAATLALAGCGTMNSITADVSSFGQWPPTRPLPRYAFERLPSQQAQADFQSRVEAAARPALTRKGFVEADSPQKADVLVQVAAQARTLYSGYDPFDRWDGRFFGGFGGFWGGRGGLGFGMSFDPPVTQMQVDVLMRDKATSQTLYETHATHRRAGGIVESLMQPMFDAALQDFPAQAISPRVVTVPIPQPAKPVSAAAPAPAPAAVTAPAK